MDNLSLTEQFSLIYLNGREVNPKNNMPHHINPDCFAVAEFLELIFSKTIRKYGENYIISFNTANEYSDSKKILLDYLKTNTAKSCPLGEWLTFINKMPNKTSNEILKNIIESLLDKEVLEIIPAVAELSCEYQLTGAKINAYRANYSDYHNIIDKISSAIYNKELLDEETISLFLLINKSEETKYIFSQAEMDKAFQNIDSICENNSLVNDYLSFETMVTKTEPEFLNHLKTKIKKNIFIETSKMFSDYKEGMQEIKTTLESSGHICEFKKLSSISIAEIDNIVYLLEPKIKRAQVINVFGVSLKRRIMP